MTNTASEPTNQFIDAPAKGRKAATNSRRIAREKSSPAANEDVNPHDAETSARAPSKIGAVIALLEREEGATLAEMVEATGWLPHTTRAALTGLKKKGHTLTKDKRDEVTCYRIVKTG